MNRINISKAIQLTVAIFTLWIGYTAPVKAQQTAVEKQAAYQKVVFDRSAKIVSKLGLTDSAKALKVTKIIAKQYSDLNDIYADRDTQKVIIKREAGDNKDQASAKLKELDAKVSTKVDKLHPKYLKSLAKAGLTPAQVDQIKDGMTYDVLHVTYTAYLNEVSELTDVQKKQIMDWLLEAREHAIDAESSNAKHAWFGKYKGRINNYLSKEGYDMKKEETEWKARGFKPKNS
ncbi:DUF3826 domain-containing protein [Mucilaginibacter robiniae]|uniref:DUF3826 domain-containing protein n=1 Tax=Mucilaginibacter robiniae TaxID=2728022 RepID=A0A7L5E692_9SPHI|nr:DUF3826 domain-containing protein [Mucilaginibacter robiniae]QJD97284.1 DUF3826 domain-containing protein [Mucilaginibacter robiniae]